MATLIGATPRVTRTSRSCVSAASRASRSRSSAPTATSTGAPSVTGGRRPVRRRRDGRRARLPASSRPARRGPLRPLHLCSPAAGRHRRRAHTGGCWGCRRSFVPHTSWPPTRRARSRDERRWRLRTSSSRGGVLRQLRLVCLSPVRQRRRAARGLGIATETGSRAGTAASTSRGSGPHARAGLYDPAADQRPLRRPAHAREGRPRAARRTRSW
jgi:hypothetical protein